MARKLFINRKCPCCGNIVDDIPDRELKVNPGAYNVEFVCTHIGRKQYFHTSCWNKMIEVQRQNQGTDGGWKIGF